MDTPFRVESPYTEGPDFLLHILLASRSFTKAHINWKALKEGSESYHGFLTCLCKEHMTIDVI